MPPPLLPMPPAPAADADLLQRWTNAHHRPQSPARSPAFVQRHASFDSPCQVPLPSTPDGYFPPQQFPSDSTDPSTPRPVSFRTTLESFSRRPRDDDNASAASDRFSSSSLPLPANVPFHTLPRTADPAAHADRIRQDHLSDVADDSESDSADSNSNSNPFTYPAPDPPTILAPTASPGPFLSHAPPPPDSWIQVETSVSEYRLIVRLPGFKRDGITLATKKRRILHVVADCWENGGGHFERRISFGYDADLVQVRAEFDGEMLRVSIPRRLPPVDLWRPAPIGRSG